MKEGIILSKEELHRIGKTQGILQIKEKEAEEKKERLLKRVTERISQDILKDFAEGKIDREEVVKKIPKFGDKIFFLRSLKEWSQTKLAKEAGLNRSEISYLESGEKNPLTETISKLAGPLEIAPQLLAGSPVFTEEEKKEYIRENYLKMESKEIAKYLGTSTKAVDDLLHHLYQEGLPSRMKIRQRKLTTEEKEKIIKYCQEGKSDREIGELLRITPNQAWHLRARVLKIKKGGNYCKKTDLEEIRLDRARALSEKYGGIDKVPPQRLKRYHLTLESISEEVLATFGGRKSISEEVLAEYGITMNYVIQTLAQRLGIRGLVSGPLFEKEKKEISSEKKEEYEY